MDPLLFAATCTICLFGDPHFKFPAPPTARAAIPNDPWAPYIAEAASRFAVPEAWVREVMRVESGGRTHLDGRPITSHAGAMGLMQVMPETYEELRQRHGLGPDPHAPRDNILAGAAYLREMYDRFGAPGFLAAYNAGPRRFEQHLTGGRALPPETQVYVARVAPKLSGDIPGAASPAVSAAVRAPLFDPTEIARAPIFVALGAPLTPKVEQTDGGRTDPAKASTRSVTARSADTMFATRPPSSVREEGRSRPSPASPTETSRAAPAAPPGAGILVNQRAPETLFMRRPAEGTKP